MIVIACAVKLLTDVELLFLYEVNKPANLELPYYEQEYLKENICEAGRKVEFRLKRGDNEYFAVVLHHLHLDAFKDVFPIE